MDIIQKEFAVGQNEGRNQKAIKVWDRRNYRDLDDSVEIGTRNIKMALRRLRKFARTGAAEELDMDDTISSTARNAGLLGYKTGARTAQRSKSFTIL
ncbi:MAG: hypothetical protein CM1200mP40_34150 [Gammaproteobacteria bacterium]|nr:MAG: hypothetical protein CM1200mP40_34150 [Gammaproteobacteria bacterium]